jgi:hypothetical protein
MRTDKQSFGEKISNWKVIQTNLQPHLPEMPHLQPIEADLVTLISKAEALDSLVELARQRRSELARDRRDLARQGDNLRARAAAHLKGSFGFTSEQLIQFGLSPIKSAGRKRKKKADKPTDPATQAAPPTTK